MNEHVTNQTNSIGIFEPAANVFVQSYFATGLLAVAIAEGITKRIAFIRRGRLGERRWLRYPRTVVATVVTLALASIVALLLAVATFAGLLAGAFAVAWTLAKRVYATHPAMAPQTESTNKQRSQAPVSPFVAKRVRVS
jgi:hypothetical protein